MLSREANGSEINWTLLRLLKPKEMSEAFGVDVPPRSRPPLPHQPSPYHGTIGKVATIGFATLGILITMLILFSVRGPLLTERMTLTQTGQERSEKRGVVNLGDS